MAIHRHKNQTTLDLVPDPSTAPTGAPLIKSGTNTLQWGNRLGTAQVGEPVYLFRSSTSQLGLAGARFTNKQLYVWSEWQDYSTTKLLSVASQNVITVTSNIPAEGAAAAASTFYYVYVADNNDNWNLTTDFRQKLFLSLVAPETSEYLLTAPNTGYGNARYLGGVYLNSSTQITGEWSVASLFNPQSTYFDQQGTSNIALLNTGYILLPGMEINIAVLSGWKLWFELNTLYACDSAVNRFLDARLYDNAATLLDFSQMYAIDVGNDSTRFFPITLMESVTAASTKVYKLTVGYYCNYNNSVAIQAATRLRTFREARRY